MASKCFYLILHSILFIITVFVVQVLSDPDGHYLISDGQQDFDITFIPLTRERRQVNQNEKKPEVPVEDKGKLTKKPTALDAKPTPPAISEPGAEKLPLGVNKKDLPAKLIKATVLQSEPHDDSKPSDTNNKNEDKPVDATPHTDIPVAPYSGTATPPIVTTKTFNKTPSTNLTNVNVPDPDIQITKMTEENIEESIKKHNLTEKQDTHLYYNSSFIVDPELGQKYWVDLDKQSNVKISDVLSQTYRRAITVKLSFDFPFYGHLIRNITIATGGFLYTGDYVHSWLAATQYIAPLMANFDTSLSNNSFVKYLDNGTAFTVQWENVILQEKPDRGGFTFQCTLHKNGDIIFVYQQVAVVIESIDDDQHPVKVGLSDAYIIDRTIFFVRRKTIYEYHRVNFHKEDIKNWTVIVLNALDTCLDMKECNSCLTKLKNFKCNWCSNRCSNGLDRHRQHWIADGCEKIKIKSVDECVEDYFEDLDNPRSSAVNMLSGGGKGMNIGIAGILGILFIVCLGLGTGIWLFYAYRNPHTPAGQFLIRYRPSQWSWRRGEARYTAATIHM